MPFEVRDLMMDVFPEDHPFEMMGCDEPSGKPPPPKPPPCEPPTARAAEVEEEGFQLAALPVFREQLRQALRS